MRNVTRWANYRRDMEASIAGLNTTTLGGATVTPATPYDQLAATLTHNKARDNDDEVFINQTDLTWKVATGAIKHTVTGGLDLAWERLEPHTYAFDGNTSTSKIDAPSIVTSYLDPNINASLNYGKSPQNENVSKADTVALYVQDQIEFTPQWKAVLGVRYDYYDSKTQQNALSSLGANTGPFAAQRQPVERPRRPHLAADQMRQSYYVSWSNGYNPSGELGVYGASSTNLNAQTQFLDPEETENYEVGATWDFTPALRLRTAIFRVEKSQRALHRSRGRHHQARGQASRRRRGARARGQHQRRNGTSISGLAYMDGQIIEGDPLTKGKHMTVAPWSGSVWTVYRLDGRAERLAGRRRRLRVVVALDRRPEPRQDPELLHLERDGRLFPAEVGRAAQRRQHLRQEVLRRRLPEQPEPRAAWAAAHRGGSRCDTDSTE